MKKKYKRLDYDTEDLENLTNGDLKKVADYALRKYLLSKQESTYYYCPIKGRSYSSDNMHVAHFIDRGIMRLRYDLRNVHLISAESNSWDAGTKKEGYKSQHHYDYEIWLREELGEKEFEKMLEESKELIIFAREDYIKVIKQFRNDNGNTPLF